MARPLSEELVFFCGFPNPNRVLFLGHWSSGRTIRTEEGRGGRHLDYSRCTHARWVKAFTGYFWAISLWLEKKAVIFSNTVWVSMKRSLYMRPDCIFCIMRLMSPWISFESLSLGLFLIVFIKLFRVIEVGQPWLSLGQPLNYFEGRDILSSSSFPTAFCRKKSENWNWRVKFSNNKGSRKKKLESCWNIIIRS